MKKTLILLALILFWTSCEKESSSQVDRPGKMEPIELTQKSKEIIAASNEFGFDMFQRLVTTDQPNENLFISPTSISLALSMILNGAASSTKEDMVRALRLEDYSLDEINEMNKQLIEGLTTVDPKVTLKLANSIWHDENIEVIPEFITVNQNYYDSKVESMDFSDPSVKNVINEWVEDKTNGKIENLISQVNPNHIMFLINAIYFKADWQIQFDKEKTGDSYFYNEEGEQHPVKMMLLTDTINYFTNETCKGVELDYGQGNFSMTILLPAGILSIDDLTHELNESVWNSWIESATPSKLTLHLPKFSFKYEKELNEMLTDMGMGVAFTESADFSNMFANTHAAIDYVKHKSFVEVDEEGTEAVAATVVGVISTSIPDELHFIANRPFLFLIREKSTGAIAFIGKYAGPA